MLYLFPAAEQWPESFYIFFSCFEKLKSSCKSKQQLNKCCIKFALFLKVFHLLIVPHVWKCVCELPSRLCIVKGCWSGLVSVRELWDHKLFNCPIRKVVYNNRSGFTVQDFSWTDLYFPPEYCAPYTDNFECCHVTSKVQENWTWITIKSHNREKGKNAGWWLWIWVLFVSYTSVKSIF